MEFCELFCLLLLFIICPRLLILIRSEGMNRKQRKNHSEKNNEASGIALLADN